MRASEVKEISFDVVMFKEDMSELIKTNGMTLSLVVIFVNEEEL